MPTITIKPKKYLYVFSLKMNFGNIASTFDYFLDLEKPLRTQKKISHSYKLCTFSA